MIDVRIAFLVAGFVLGLLGGWWLALIVAIAVIGYVAVERAAMWALRRRGKPLDREILDKLRENAMRHNAARQQRLTAETAEQ